MTVRRGAFALDITVTVPKREEASSQAICDNKKVPLTPLLCADKKNLFFMIRRDNRFPPADRGIRTDAGPHKQRWRRSWKD